MVKSHDEISSNSMGLFDIAVSANNFFQFGTNYLALFWFIIFASNLSICDKVLCECERIAVDNTKLTNETTKLPNDVCALSAEKMNSQAKLKICCHDQANSSTNNSLVGLDASPLGWLGHRSSSNVDLVLPALKQPYCCFMQMLRRKEMSRMQM